MSDCLFCKIATKATETPLIYQDEQVVAFNDIHPQAPYHVLIIPRRHINTINDISANDSLLLGHMMSTAKEIAKQLKIANDGYRLLFNCNSQGGQAVYHIHLHLLGGRQMLWPPG